MDGSTAYSYGPFNRLTNASGAAFLYSAGGQRLWKAFGGATTLYAPGAGGAVLGQTQSGYWSDYVWLNGRVVARVRQGGIYPIYTDQTGRPIALTCDDNTILWAAQGAPFDREITVSGSAVNVDVGFPGQLHDSEDGLWHNGARDYDASLGRYIESDSVGLAGGVNTYAYVGNNPISNVDPLGLCSSHEWHASSSAPSPQTYQVIGEAMKRTSALGRVGGLGNNYVATIVALKWTLKPKRSPIKILELSSQSVYLVGSTSVEIKWVTNPHLNVAYGAVDNVDFQAIKAAGLDIISHQ